MDADLRVLAKTLDPTLIGARVREARIRAGLTQSEAAGGAASTAYVSRVESGARRGSVALLTQLADALGTSVEVFLAPDADAPEYVEGVARVQLELDYAELALRTGRLEPALVGATSVVGSSEAPVSLRNQGRYLRGLTLEAMGDLDAAIAELELLAAAPGDDVLWVRVSLALSRCHRFAGDFSRAVDVGERAVARLDDLGLSGDDDAVQLAVTLAGAHFARGDVAQAVRVCSRALEQAEHHDSVAGRAAAYWNSSIFEDSRGNVSGALALAHRALALLERTDDARNLARLRTEMGLMQLKSDPPEPALAVEHLLRAHRELEWTSASADDLARNQLGLAQASLLLGDVDRADQLAAECLHLDTGESPLQAGAAHLLRGRIAWQRGRHEESATAIAAARSAAGSVERDVDRRAAQLWFDIATTQEEQGDLASAVGAYRRAGRSTGLAQVDRSSVTAR